MLGLRRDAIGLREVLFQSITNMAPGAAIAAAIPAGALYAGGALPLSVLVALVACLLSASCIGLLARELPSAGSLATYTARGLHPAVGFLTAWGYVLVGVLIAPISLLQLGFTTASTINSDFHGYPANLWWPWSLAGAVIILAAGFYGIRTSARLGTLLGTTEIAVFGVLAVFFVVHAGHANTAAVFTTQYTPKGFHGISGVIAGSVYSILAFGGFEGAAPLAEEARDPRRTVPRAVLLATLGIGLLYVFTTYAVDVAFGPAAFAGFGSSGVASWVGMARSLYGLFWFFVFLAIVNSTVANANAGFNVASRTGYAMGRIGAFPHRGGPGAPPAPLAGGGHLCHLPDHRGGHARTRPGLQPDERVRDGRDRDRDRHRRGVHRGQRGLHRVLRLFCSSWARSGAGTRCCT